jgi:hypothetical protein
MLTGHSPVPELPVQPRALRARQPASDDRPWPKFVPVMAAPGIVAIPPVRPVHRVNPNRLSVSVEFGQDCLGPADALQELGAAGFG